MIVKKWAMETMGNRSGMISSVGSLDRMSKLYNFGKFCVILYEINTKLPRAKEGWDGKCQPV